MKKRSICGKLDCFLRAGDRDSLEEDNLADKAVRDKFALF